MKVCLVAPPRLRWEEHRSVRRLAALLGGDHEVTLIAAGPAAEIEAEAAPEPGFRETRAEPRPEMYRTVFAGADHRLSAAIMETIQSVYGREGPDYLEVADHRAHGLVPLMARRCADSLLERTRFGVRLLGTAEIEGLHDGKFGDPELRLLGELEREQLRLADHILWPGGDAVDLYRRYYPFTLPDAVRLGLPESDRLSPVGQAPEPGGPLRILFLGELRRGTGALDLAEACLRLPVDDWELTFVGPDTPTAPAGQSVAMTIEAMFDEDPRLRIEPVEEGEEPRPDWGRHDLVVVPSRFAVWPAAARWALRVGLPVLGTPVGGLPALVEEGRTGWLTDGLGAEAIGRSLLRLVENRGEVDRVRATLKETGAPVLWDADAVRDGYERLLASASPAMARPRTRPAAEPLVSGVIPYHRGSAFIGEAVRSLLEQSHRRIEAVIVNDGSFEPADAMLEQLAADPRVTVVTQRNRGEANARNLGARLARGDYVVMLDADNALEPQFVSRALAVCEREPELAYVSCWLRFIAPDGSLHPDPTGYAPLGNSVVADDINNWDGDTLALLPRRVFTECGMGFDPAAIIYSDWEFYRSLRDAGMYGTVIPERLARYRVLGSSLQRAHGSEMQRRGWNEARGRRMLRATRWTAEN